MSTGVESVDVAIVGGGPVGMFCALELLAHGLDVVVLERNAERDARLRARVTHSQTLALLDRRGLLDDLQPSERRTIVHFAGMECIDLSLIRADHRYALFVQQQVLEARMESRLEAMGCAPRRLETVRELVDGGEQVSLTIARGGPGSDAYALTASVVLACDGGASGLRKQLGIPFDGSEPTFVAYQGLMSLYADVPLAEGWHRTVEGMYVVGPGRRMALVDYGADPRRRRQPGALESEFGEALSRVVGHSATASDIASLTRFTDNSRVARAYRSGRTLLVGDAAHVHPPFAGQGLNLGLQDAANVAWKVAAFVKGHADERLLDTYELERRPIADRVVELSLSQSALMRPDEQTSALRLITRRMLDDASANRLIAELVGGVTTRYPGIGQCACAGTYAFDEPLVVDGRSTTLVRLQRQHPSRHIVVADPSHELPAVPPAVLVARTVATGVPRRECDGQRVLRPDGYIAACSAERGELLAALQHVA